MNQKPEFFKTELSTGLRVVSEAHPDSRAVSLGIVVLTGTRHEGTEEGGISHFLEHLVFKGTSQRSAYEIARSLEAVGGEINAYTTREYTFFHALVLKEDWRLALSVLSDLVTHMKLTLENLELERSVVLQEILMSEDNQEENIYDVYMLKGLGSHTLGRPIQGTTKSILGLKQRDILSFYKTHYQPWNMIVTAAGAIDHDQLIRGCEEFLSKKEFSLKLSPPSRVRKSKPPTHKPFSHNVVHPGGEQLHLLLGFPAPSFRDPDRFESFVANALLGGGMTSRFYQSIREKKGLAYTVYSQLNSFTDFGLINVYVACAPENMKMTYKILLKDLKKITQSGVKKKELELFKKQITGHLLLGSDDVENRMTSIAVNEMVFKEYRPVEAVIEELQQVTVERVNTFLAKQICTEKMGRLLLGSKSEEQASWWN